MTRLSIAGGSENFIPQKWISSVLFFTRIGQALNLLRFAVLGLVLIAIILFIFIALSDRSDKISKTNQRNNSSPEMVRLVDQYNQILNSLKASKETSAPMLNPAFLIGKAGNAATQGIRFTEITWESGSKKIGIKAEAADIRRGMDLIDTLKNMGAFKKVKLISIKERPANTQLEALNWRSPDQ